MSINIEQAMHTAHQCASVLQELAFEHPWLSNMDETMIRNYRRTDNERAFLAYLLEDGDDASFRSMALTQEVALLRVGLQMASAQRKSVTGLRPEEYKERDQEMLAHTGADTLIKAARERVSASIALMQEMLSPVSSRKMTP